MRQQSSGARVLVSSALVCAVLGSVHAFSVFLVPLEQAFEQSRATISLTYSFALVALTLAVLAGPRLYSLMPPWSLFVSVGVIGATGAMLAGSATGIFGVWIGYSVCFGLANGLGYGFALQYAAHANPSRSGGAMGVVTAAYAFSAAIAPVVFVSALKNGGFFGAMSVLAAALLVATIGAGWIARTSHVRYAPETPQKAVALPSALAIAKIWIAYGSGVAAGLMVIGHAAGIAEAAGMTPWLAPAALAICNMIGSLVAGHMVDRTSPRITLRGLPMVSIAALIVLALFPPLTLIALGMLGFAYGGIIAAYPAVIARQFPGKTGPRVYGMMFTAWGAAGLMAPWAAGMLFDRSGGYDLALWIATGLAVLSAGMAAKIGR